MTNIFTDKSLYIVVLGGRTKKTNIELHDVRWVAAKSINETFSQLRNEWFGDLKGLHIDSYIKLKYIDGYEVKLSKITRKRNKKESLSKNRLWFINLGFYFKNNLYEQHQLRVVTARSRKEAKYKATRMFSQRGEIKHCDDIVLIETASQYSLKSSIETIEKFEVVLMPCKQGRFQKIEPDFVGYLSIDK